jgi:hypothetical protein
VAAWCFIKGRFIPAGILCLAVSLAIKPHDAGLVWLCGSRTSRRNGCRAGTPICLPLLRPAVSMNLAPVPSQAVLPEW